LYFIEHIELYAQTEGEEVSDSDNDHGDV